MNLLTIMLLKLQEDKIMKQETISTELRLKYNQGSINPIDINEQYLTEAGIVDDNNKLNRGMLRIGSLGTNLVFTNDTKDEIRVQPAGLVIESKSIERIKLILGSLKKKFSETTIVSGELISDTHLMDDTYPESIFKNYVKTGGLELEVIQLTSENIVIVMYSCGKGKIHLKQGIQSNIEKRLGDLVLEEDLELEKLRNVSTSFIKQDLLS